MPSDANSVQSARTVDGLGYAEVAKRPASNQTVPPELPAVDAEMVAILRSLRKKGSDVRVLKGLSDEQFGKLEGKFKFKFPPDVRRFLKAGVPINVEKRGSKIPEFLPEMYQTANDGWHNWHVLALDSVEVGDDRDTVTKQIMWHATPREGLPSVPSDAPLIPLCNHRMIPSNPSKAGNPVFSMHGCYDNIIYGDNFWLWLVADHEVELPSTLDCNTSTPLEEIPFWPRFIDTWIEGTTGMSTEGELENEFA